MQGQLGRGKREKEESKTFLALVPKVKGNKRKQTMLRISLVEINGFLTYIFQVLEFLIFLAIWELSFLQAVSYKKIRILNILVPKQSFGKIRAIFRHLW